MFPMIGARASAVLRPLGIADPLHGPGTPFPVTIGPEQAVAHRSWAEARDRALSALLTGRGLVLVLGAPGTGKTLLLQELARTLRAAGTDVILQPRGDFPIDAAETGMAGVGAGRRRVVLIDEAHRMNEAALERLGRLGQCAFVLAGLSDPGDDRPGQPSQAAAAVVRLAALQPPEVRAFVARRLAQFGLSADLLSSEAVARLGEHSGGMPRVLNMLAGSALFLARAEGASRVEATHVDQAAKLRDGNAETYAAGQTTPMMPHIVPGQQIELSPPQVVAPSAVLRATVAALPIRETSSSAPRRRRLAALGAAIGVAAACGGSMAWHGGHAQRASPLMAAAPLAPPLSGPLAPLAQPGTTPGAPPATAAQVKLAVPPERVTGSQTASLALAARAEPVAPTSVKPGALPLSATSAPPEREALSSGAPTHVLVRYTPVSADAAARAASLAVTLRAAGFVVDALVPLLRKDEAPGAHYFFVEDQGAADATLRAVGLPGKGSLGDAVGVSAWLRPGLIELVVPPGQVELGSRAGPPSPRRS